MLKTRRRKGLGDQIAVSKYLDDEFVVRVAVFPRLQNFANGRKLACVVSIWTCRFVRIDVVFRFYVC